MARYRNGDIPAHLLIHMGGEHYATAGTKAKIEALIADIWKNERVRVWVTSGPNIYRDIANQIATKNHFISIGKGWMAAAPRFSSHGGEFEGKDALAVDFSGYDALGVNKWYGYLRKHGFEAGYFNGKNGRPYEPWHAIDWDPYRNVVAPTPTKKPEEAEVKHYHLEDADARKVGRTLTPGNAFWLNATKGASASKATNIVGGIGTYSITPHVYATGNPGDVLELSLAWDDTKTAGPHSIHYVERLVADKDGLIRASREFKRAVAKGYAVYARLIAPTTNKAPMKVTVFDSDAFLFLG